MPDEPILLPPPSIWFHYRKILLLGLLSILIIVLASFYIAFWRAPADFPSGLLFPIEKGETLSGVAERLQSEKIIRSPWTFKAAVTLLAGSRGLTAGDYDLSGPDNVFHLAWRLTHSAYGLSEIRVTIPEGTSVKEISVILAGRLGGFSQVDFLALAGKYEGYLFPDTYNFLPNVSAEAVISEMRDNFSRKISQVSEQIKISGHSEEEIIKMASIAEEEARTMESRQIVAGILWKRLAIHMPLQVDSSFKYINGKTTGELTTADLQIDSPYNSYIHQGLPPTPICNPGLAAIQAVLVPKQTDYLYFLTDRNGEMHYARTYDEHLANKNRYLP